MNNSDVKVLIVDDSSFQITLLHDMLEENGFNVIGQAMSLEECKEQVKKNRPDIVTMDITIPGTDGFECTEAIHEIDSTIKVIIVSSMRDDELVSKAKRIGISGFVQKPVDEEELVLLINRLMQNDDLFKKLQEMYKDAFKEATLNVFNRFTKTVPEISKESEKNHDFDSEGVSVVLGVIGKYCGRILVDTSKNTAAKLAEKLLKRSPKSEDEMFNVIEELANMITGNSCSIINKKEKVFGLRVAPPTILSGDKIRITKSDLECVYSYEVNSILGDLTINVGFTRGGIRMDVKYINPVIDAIGTIMPQLGFTKVEKKGLSLKGKSIDSLGVVVVIGIIGDLKGNIIYGLNCEDAKKIASTMMMGMPIAELDEMAQSALSEMVNMVTANVATNYSKDNIIVDISTPTLFTGDFIATASSDQVVCINLDIDGISLDVNISINN